MPRTFFDQVLVTETPRRGSGWMKAASLIVHVVVVLAILVLPITAAFDLPGIYTSLPPVMLATVSNVPPPPPMSREVSEAPVFMQTVPLEAPAGIQAEVERPPAPPSPLAVPGGIGTIPNLQGVGINNSTLSIPPPPPREAQAPRRVGGDIKPPQRVASKAPQYPPAAQAARIEGMVILEAIIDAEGVVQNVTVLKSVPLLERAAIEAVQQWRYTPTRLNGVAIPIIMSVTVTFALR